MEISVVIPVRNREKLVGPCIESVLDQDIDKSRFEVIVVDNGSTDGTARVVKSYPVRYMYLERPSISAARNLAIRSSSAEYIALIDSDATAEKDWLKSLIGGFDHPRVAGCGGRILRIYSEDGRGLACYSESGSFVEPSSSSLTPFIGMNAMLKRHAVIEAGLFDESSLLELQNEDVDLSWRLRLIGYRLKYIDSAVVRHAERFGAMDLFNKGYMAGRSDDILERKYSFIARAFKARFYLYESLARMLLVHCVRRPDIRTRLLLFKKAAIFTIGYLTGRAASITKGREAASAYRRFGQDLNKMASKVNGHVIKSRGEDLRISEGVFWLSGKDRTAIANISSGDAFFLNESGSFIWGRLIDSVPAERIASDLGSSYMRTIPEAEDDVAGLIAQLQTSGFLEAAKG